MHGAGMRREVALDRLKRCETRLRERGVRSLFLFGSTARDEAGERSDIDLLFDHDPASRFSLFTQAELIEELSTEIGARVDLIALDGLRPAFRERVTPHLVQVF